MIRNLKALGLLVVGALMMSAMFATGAQAQGGLGLLTTGETPKTHTTSTLHAKQIGEFTHNIFEVTGAEKLHCENEGVTMTSTPIANGTTIKEEAITITPTYKDCYSFDVNHNEDRPATVEMTGCDYTLYQPKAVDLEDHEWTGNVGLDCPEGQAIHIKVFQFGTMTSHSLQVCEFTVTPFVEKPHYTVTVDNDEVTPNIKKDELTVTVKVENIIVHRTGLCGAAKIETAKYVNTLTVTATDGVNHDDVWISTEGE